LTSEARDDQESLTPDEWETVKDMVFACHAMAREAQPAWLDEHCPPGRVRAEVERLLGGTRVAQSFMSVSAPQQVLATPAVVPSRIGRFKIERQLGAGGMGVVYAAVDERLGRHVALKVLQPDATPDEERRKRLVWDARAASALNHPNIVTVYETGDSDGVDYVAMELVAGRTLADALHAEPWPQSRVLGVAVQVAAALEAAHAQGMVNRDLKPSNVILTSSGTAKLVDFGLAKSVRGLDTAPGAPTTIEGRLAGTVAYMSPEQAEGSDIDFRSDIFSFGSLLYEMLTRQRAFAGASTVSILAKIIHTQPPIPTGMSSAIDSRLQDIVNRCLRKDRSRRFQSMGDVRVRLQEIIDEPVPPGAEPPRSGTPVWKYALSAAVLVALGAAGAALAFWPRHTAAPPTFTRLTWDGGLTAYPAVSPDGTMLAYASDRGSHGNLVIWIERLGAGDPIPLTSDSADQSAPDISPDGTRVAYRSERNGGGVYVSSLGGTPHLVAQECRDPKYSPDGKTIACWIGDVGGAFYPKTARIVLVPTTGGGAMRPFRPDFDAAAFPLWMPDGRLLFLGRKTVAQPRSIVDRLWFFGRKTAAQPAGPCPACDWWIAGESPEQGEHATGAVPAIDRLGLKPVPGTYWFRPAAWQSDGGAVLFSAHRDDATNVWRLPISASGTAAAVPEPVTLGAGSDEHPTAPVVLASDRDFFVFSRIDVDYQLRQVPLKSSNAQPEPLLPGVSQIGSPSASIDGRRVVYSAPQPNGYRVVSVDMATTDERSVTTVESHDFVRVLLSGDGKVVVYSGPEHVGYRMRIDQGQPEAICVSCGWPTHVNLDGSAALFESYKDRERLIVWSKGTTKPLIANPDPKNRRQYAGVFSPNGHWVAFCASAPDGNGREIFIVPNAPDRQLRDDEWISISDGETSDRQPAWSTDGRRLFFISDRDGFRCIWARDIDQETGRPSGPAVAIAHFHHARELLRGPMASPGSIGLTATTKALIFTVARSIGDIWWQRAGR